MMKMKKPELLSPAGDWEKLQMAVLYGADAVYLAGTSFGMRSFAGNFDDEALPKAVRFAHDHGVKVHATVNTMPRWNEAEALPAHLEKLDAAGVDALILADLGAFTLAGKYAPHCQRHISTQQSIANHVCAQAWYDLGASRVVLARELSPVSYTHLAVYKRQELDRCGITLNKNCVPGDNRSPFQTSGVRIGTAAMPTKGYTAEDFCRVARRIDAVSYTHLLSMVLLGLSMIMVGIMMFQVKQKKKLGGTLLLAFGLFCICLLYTSFATFALSTPLTVTLFTVTAGVK